MNPIPRILELVYSGLWAITPEAFTAIDRALQLRLSAQQPVAITAPAKKPLSALTPGKTIGILSIEGIIGKRLSTIEGMCGGCDMEEVLAHAKALADNPSVGTIILDISSPGGTVTGLVEAHAALVDIACRKTLVAYTDTQMCSAAYWLATAAHSIYCSPSATLGSIGVYTTVVDRSRQLAAEGVNVQAIQGGKYKTDGAPWKPLDDAARARVQERVDHTYATFKAAVSGSRPQVQEETMQGQAFLGEASLTVGLADANYNSLQDLVRALVDITPQS